MTPQNYYACRSQRRRQEVDVALVLELVKAQREQQPRLGVRKLYYLIAPELKAAGVKLGRGPALLPAGLGPAGATTALGSAETLLPDRARAQSGGSEAGAGPALCGVGQGGAAGGEKALGMA